MTERTLVLVKPDGVSRGLVGEVITRLERKGLRLVAAELRTLTADTAETHYAEHRERPFFGSLVEFITSGPLMALVVEGPRAMPADELGALAVDIFGGDRVSVSPRLAEALEEAIELAEAGPDDALGGSGVLVTGSVITAGEARTLMGGRRP